MADAEHDYLEVIQPVLDTALDAVIVMRPDGTIAGWNDIAENIFGWRRDEALGRAMSDLIVPSQYREQHVQGLARYNESGRATILNRTIEVTALRRDGTIFPVELSITPTQAGPQRLFIGFLRDITGRKQAEAILARRATEAELLFKLARLSAEAEDFADALRACLEAICLLAGWPVGHALIAAGAPTGSELVSSGVWYGDEDPRVSHLKAATDAHHWRRGVGLPGAALETGEPSWIIDIENDPRFLRKGHGFAAAFAFPISSGGEILAVLEFFSAEKTEPDPDLLLIVRTLGAQLGRILEHKLATTALAQSQERLNLAVAASGMVIWELDLITDTLQPSPELALFLGYPSDQPLDIQTVRSLYYPGERERILGAAEAARAQGRSDFEVEFRIRDGRGFNRWILLRARVSSDDKGHPARMIGVALDISDRRKADEALRASEQRFRLLIEGVTDYAIIMLDRNGCVTDWNAGAESIKGYSPEEIIGKHFRCFFPSEDVAERKPEQALQLAAQERRFEEEGWRIRKDGSKFLAHVVIEAIFDDRGELVGFSTITRDITERNQLREAQKLATLGQLTGGLAHDFNNLLAVVIGNLECIDEDEALSAETRELVDSALSASVKGAELVRQLLAFSRRQTLTAQEFDLNELVTETTDLLRRLLGEAIEVRTQLGSNLPFAVADPTQVESALTNLAVNARDAMPRGGCLTIETKSVYLDEDYAANNAEVTAGEYLLLALSDTGEGIAPEVLDRVYEPFFTTKPEGKGSGLGLSMVYGFAKQSGGHLKIYSEIGHGTTVRLYLPSSSTTASRDQGGVGPHDASAEELGTWPSETILVVDDNENVRRIVTRQLAGLGYKVLEAEDPSSALRILEQETQIDLLFTDVVMPGGMTGEELASRAKKLWPELKLLFTSGFAQIARKEEGLAGLITSENLLSKPYRKHELAARVRQILDD